MKRLPIILLFVAAIFAWFQFDLGQYLTLDALKARQGDIAALYAEPSREAMERLSAIAGEPVFLMRGLVWRDDEAALDGLEQALVGLDRVTDLLEPAGDRSLGDALSERGEDHGCAHDCVSFRSSMSVV